MLLARRRRVDTKRATLVGGCVAFVTECVNLHRLYEVICVYTYTVTSSCPFACTRKENQKTRMELLEFLQHQQCISRAKGDGGGGNATCFLP